MTMFRWIAALVTAIILSIAPVAAPAQQPLDPVPAPASPAPAGGREGSRPMTPAGGHELTAQDVNAWLDGFLPYSLARGDIAGAVVVVVKDGQVLTQRGYGFADVAKRIPVDPERTLFRVGSTSKLFTWTAVMQLVEQGKIDLDADINRYLDFRIASPTAKPITMRNLMTHTGGFEEAAKYLMHYDPAEMRPLRETVSAWVPRRIFAPGEQPGYSNYATTVAGYIVQRVSGENYADYVRRHILGPLGMRHSTFVQPLPDALRPLMSKGYGVASQPARPFELVDAAPAGALSASGGDMAKFMIAHLQDGGRLLRPATARRMHSLANRPIPGLPGMALGFYQTPAEGLNVISHGGDTILFHTDLHLILDKGVGVFMSFNSRGKEDAAYPLRSELFERFVNRYFPAPERNLPTAPTAREHGAAMAGHYISSRGSLSNWWKLLSLIGQTSVTLNPDSTITVSDFTDAAGVPRVWREVAPWQWQDVNGTGRLAAVAKDGRVVSFATAEFAPIVAFLPAPASMNAAWVMPALFTALGVLALTLVSWPIVALVRRHYKLGRAFDGRYLQLHRASRVTALLFVAVAAMWLAFVSLATADIVYLDGRLDPWMRLAQLLSIAGIPGTALTCWYAWRTVRGGRGWKASLWSVLIALSAVFLSWFVISMRLVTIGLNY